MGRKYSAIIKYFIIIAMLMGLEAGLAGAEKNGSAGTNPPAAEKVGILLVQHGEAENWKFSEWNALFKKMFSEFKNTKVPVPPRIVWPYLAWKMRSHYKAVGGKSQFVEVSKKQLALLQKELPELRIYDSYMDMVQPDIKTAVRQMIQDGITKIVAIPVLLTDSSHTEEIKTTLEEAQQENQSVRILFARPLFYKADSLIPMCTRLILDQAGTMPRNRTGVVIASHGEPDEWVRLKTINTRCNQQETAFRDMLKKELIQLGFSQENITSGFNEFIEPKITPAVEKIALNVDKIITIPSFGQAKSLHHIYDIPTKVKKAKIPKATELCFIYTWALEPETIKALADLYRDALNGVVYQF